MGFFKSIDIMVNHNGMDIDEAIVELERLYGIKINVQKIEQPETDEDDE